MYKLLTLVFLLLICFGCSDDQLPTERIPENVQLDIDQDGNSDFIVAYTQQTEGDPGGNYQSMKMKLE